MRVLRLVAALMLVATAAPAQLAVTQPTERLLVLPLSVTTPADSATSVQVMDAVRERLVALARYKALIITKSKLCEALTASGFPCDGLLDDQQAQQLARFLTAHAYTAGLLAKTGTTWVARMRVVDISSSGFASSFTVRNGNPGSTAAFVEAIAQRLFTVIKAGEHARQCNTERSRGAFARAAQAAQKAFALDSNATAAHLCMLNTYEAQRMPPESLIAAASRALKGDSLYAVAWERLASAYQQKGDTVRAIEAFKGLLSANPRHVGRRLGLAQMLFHMKHHQEAADLLTVGLATNPGDQAMLELQRRVCIEGSLYRCALESLKLQREQDTIVLGDSTWLKTVLGAAQQVSDTAALLDFTAAATTHFPNSASFWKARGSAYELAGQPDSAIWAYRKSLAIDPSDVPSALLVAKAMVDGAVWDTGGARQAAADSVRINALRAAFADRLDTAKVYLSRGLATPDSGLHLSATVIMLTAGSKLAQIQAYARAYPWLEQTLQQVAPRTPGDTLGPRKQVRVNAGFWFGLSSVQTLVPAYQAMITSKDCGEAKTINDRIAQTKEALILGARVHPPTANSLLQNLSRFEDLMPRVKQQFKCTNF
ncbi:MAG: tetratricopeptide repeat protein [Gemmatimonadetes bacterium]|nr:tetratricopeptide repeat protein [Gemmatimonadota bacterium]